MMKVRIADGRIATLVGFKYGEEHRRLLELVRAEAPFVPILAIVGGKATWVRACGLALGREELEELNGSAETNKQEIPVP